jgi:hypothetical protein
LLVLLKALSGQDERKCKIDDISHQAFIAGTLTVRESLACLRSSMSKYESSPPFALVTLDVAPFGALRCAASSAAAACLSFSNLDNSMLSCSSNLHRDSMNCNVP